MSGSGYALFMTGLIVSAAVVGLLSFDAEAWITRDLKRGDLYSLTDVASGLRPDGLTHDQARRLQARGLVRPYGRGHFRATLKGRLALRLRRLMRRAA